MSTIAIVGAGPGLGLYTAKVFGGHGFDVALIARKEKKLDGFTASLQADGIKAAGFAADAADQTALASAMERAAARFGFKFEGVFRQHVVFKAGNRDTAWFSIIDGEWPALRAAYEAWLDPDNFDAAGSQKRTLEDFRRDLGAV